MSQEASVLKEDRKKVAQRAFSMASGTLTSRILGLMRDIALAALFDRAITDAWAAAFRLPNLFRRLFGEGSLGVSFIPVFMEAQVTDPSGTRARNLANGFYTLLLICLGTFSALGILFAENLLSGILSSDYQTKAEQWELTVRMARIMFGFIFFVSSYSYFMGLLNALGSFGLPALAPALLNISMLVFTFMPPHWFPVYGDGLAWGVLIGGFLQAGLLWGVLKSKNYLPRWQLKLWTSDVQRVIQNLGPSFLGMGLFQFSTLVNLYFASSLPSGAISSIYFADRLLEFPLSLVSVSLGTALLPMLSSWVAEGKKDLIGVSVRQNFVLNFYLAFPAAMGLYFLSGPIVRVLFYRGHFTTTDLLATAEVLQILALSLIFIAAARVLVPVYYALHKSKVPALSALTSLGLHIVLAGWWTEQMGLRGLMISGLISSVFQFGVLLFFLRSQGIGLFNRALKTDILKVLLAGSLLVIASQSYSILESSLPSWLALVGTIFISGAAYFLASFYLRIEAFQFLYQTLRAKKSGKN